MSSVSFVFFGRVILKRWTPTKEGAKCRSAFSVFFLEKVFGRETDNGDPRPTEGAIPQCVLPESIRRIALLPFALLVELLAPVPVGVLNLESGAAISAPN